MSNNLLHQADENYKNQNIETALNQYLDLLFKDEPTSYLFMKIAHCNKILGDNRNAVDYYVKAIDLDRTNYEAIYNYADSLMLIGIYDEGIEQLEHVSQVLENTDNPYLELSKAKKIEIQGRKHNYLGGKYIKEKKFDEAEVEFLKAIEIYPADRRNYTNLGVVYLNKNEIPQAIEMMAKAIEIDNKYIRGYYNLGTILLKNGYFQQAVNVFEKSLEIDSKNADTDDILKNLSVAQDNLEQYKTELITKFNEEIMSISNDFIFEYSNAVLPETAISTDFIFTKDNRKYILAHCKNCNFKIFSQNENLEIEKII